MTHPDLLDEQYPECEKLNEVAPYSQKIVEFLNWLSNEKGIELADYEKSDRFHFPKSTNENLLAEFFDIDMVKVEQERQAILESVRG